MGIVAPVAYTEVTEYGTYPFPADQTGARVRGPADIHRELPPLPVMEPKVPPPARDEYAQGRLSFWFYHGSSGRPSAGPSLYRDVSYCLTDLLTWVNLHGWLRGLCYLIYQLVKWYLN